MPFLLREGDKYNFFILRLKYVGGQYFAIWDKKK